MSEWLSETPRKAIERAVSIYMQRVNFTLRAASNVTGDDACEDLNFPGDFAVAAEIIAERLEGLARAYRAQAEEWKKR